MVNRRQLRRDRGGERGEQPLAATVMLGVACLKNHGIQEEEKEPAACFSG